MIYKVDGPTFLERQRRMGAILDRMKEPGGFVVADLVRDFNAVANEVPPLELVPGDRYRVRTVAGDLELRHTHFRDLDSGREVAMEIPEGTEPTFRDLEVEYVGRVASSLDNRGALIFALENGMGVMIGDIDVLELEPLR